MLQFTTDEEEDDDLKIGVSISNINMIYLVLIKLIQNKNTSMKGKFYTPYKSITI